VERREAFHLAGVEDPTVYADPDFWKAATEGFKAPGFQAEEIR
jgi:7-cyano-7-deazaguanine synthase